MHDPEEYESLLDNYSHSVEQSTDRRQTTGACMRCRLDFQCYKLGFSHDNKHLFCRSQWPWPPIIFILYRFLMAAYMLTWLVYTAVTFPPALRNPWAVWLTNWSFLLLNLHMVLACLISVINYDGNCCKNPQRNIINNEPMNGPMLPSPLSHSSQTNSDMVADKLPWYIKVDWFLFAIVSNISFIVSIIYFTVLFPQILTVHQYTPLVSDFHLHLVNSVVILLEVALSGIPVRILHVVYPCMFGAIYISFSVVYWAFDHSNVLYPGVLDWNNPGITVAVTAGLALVGVPLLQLFLFSLYQARLKMFSFLKLDI